MRKNELLLLHGTIYGQIPAQVPWYDCPFKTSNIDQYGKPTDIPYLLTELRSCITGDLANNTPIDVVHWNAAGVTKWSGMEWWEGCMTLFMRHV
ncbi:hypothetical protein [Desulfobulbus sp.]|uniref:hypothetical protein n=1 Tax=Desulfobulbus sp. TaxID=895 RepID=UPI00286F4D8D|nr:hypothetical protein [Desulfobulbus sp.]